ncbi:MAG: 2-enoyl thioester reductase domain-containing protein [Myxococcota bacterium]|nr:2-enoyl thioester reductase domain-containing protein [Myxococcota bacterium]
MLAVRYARHGRPRDVLELVELPVLEPSPSQVVIEVTASPINPLDLLLIQGFYPLLPQPPCTGGVEGVGRIKATGSAVQSLKPGDTVLLPVRHGAWAKEVLVEAQDVLRLPAEIDPVQACMLRINPPTALLLLTHFSTIEPGDWILQFPGTSSVGQLVVQLAAQMGIRTVSIIRNPERASLIQQLGGDAIVVAGDNLAKRVAQATEGAPIQLALDAVGGSATHQLARCLAPGATVVSYGALSRNPSELGVDQSVFRDITLRGFWLFQWNQEHGQTTSDRLVLDMAEQTNQGNLASKIDSEYPLEDVLGAIERARSPDCFGRVVLRP